MKKNQTKYHSARAFQAAEAFIQSQGRSLDIARFNHLFNGADVADVVTELKKYQNDDGGFGQALEADLRAPESSAVCTTVAFQVIREHHISGDEEMVKLGVAYFADTLDRDELHWRIIPESADAHPHAPWWTQEGRDSFELNPSAEILGYLLDYGESVIEESLLTELTDRVVECLCSLEKIEMHDLLCCLRLLDSRNLSASIYQSVVVELKRLTSSAVATNPEQWTAYSLRPLQVVSRPDSPFLDGLEESISQNLEFEMNEQEEDGSWQPAWSWGGLHPESWAVAKREWSGWLTLEKLLIFRRFSCIERV